VTNISKKKVDEMCYLYHAI